MDQPTPPSSTSHNAAHPTALRGELSLGLHYWDEVDDGIEAKERERVFVGTVAAQGAASQAGGGGGGGERKWGWEGR